MTKISFKDGDIVHEGDVLFEIDATPYQIKLDQAKAQVAIVNGRVAGWGRNYYDYAMKADITVRQR